MKKAKLLSLLLAAVMLLSLIPAVGLTATAATATATAPTLPPALPTDDIYKAGHNGSVFVFNTSEGNIDTTMGLLSASETTPLIPEELQGIAFDVYSTITWDDFIVPTTTSGGEVKTAGIHPKEMGTLTIPANATGFLIHYENKGTNVYTGASFAPTIDGKSYPTTDCERTNTPYHVYWYDAENQAWRVNSSKDGTSHSFRIPADFNGYLYIPFESLDLNSAAVAGKTLTDVAFGGTWTDDEKVFHSVSIVGKKATGTNYTVTWQAGRSQITELYAENVTPVSPYNTTALIKATDSAYIYESFKSWDKPITAVTADVIYTATWNTVASKPATLPGNPSDIKVNGYGVPSGGSANVYWDDTSLGALSQYSSVIPEGVWGRTYALESASFTSTIIKSAKNATVTFDSPITIPSNATGFFVQLNFANTGASGGFSFTPIITDATGLDKSTITTNYYNNNKDNTGADAMVDMNGNGSLDNWDCDKYQSYYYDGSTWRVEIGGGHTIRHSGGFEGWYYIPFESFLQGDDFFDGKEFTGATINCSNWDGADKLIVNAIAIATVDEITSASITVSNSLNLNVYAALNDATATLNVTPVNTELADKAQTGITGTKQADGTYKFTYKNILPQLMGEKFKVELVSGGKVVDSGEFSVREYCETLLNDANSAADLKALVVDILKYGAAAQNYADYNTTDLATKNLNTTQLALGAAVSNKVGTDATLTPATAATQFTSATLRLQDAVALRLNITSAEAAANVSVTVTLGSKSQTYTGATLTATDGGYTVLFTNISATEYAETITATVSVNGTLTQTLTYSVNTYLANVNATAGSELGALVDAIYAYGVSASAYAGN